MTALPDSPARLARAALILCLALTAAPLPALAADEGLPAETLTLLDSDGDGAISAAEIDAFIPQIHAAMDTNEDGSLEAAEAATVLSPDQIAAVDADGDGIVTVAELGTVLRADFAAADRDGNGLID